ncbi:MAG TPA: transcription elongation factor [Bacteroidia bacterium]|jgi:hypothetical protein|nr:transcription elongation factor [Bacteroidia bacterium]
MEPFTKKEQLQWKQDLRDACIAILQKRVDTSALAMQQAQESANSDDKSSAGDKYETGRAMGQRDHAMHAAQMQQARQELALIKSIPFDQLHTQAGMGSVVVCRDYIFFISLGLGFIENKGRKVALLSAQAPLAAALKMKKKGDSFLLNGRTVEMLDVF